MLEYVFILCSYLSHSLADHWGTTVNFTTSFLHSSQFSAFHSMIFHSRPVHSLMLSSHHFLCLPLCHPPWTVPCRIVLASPDDHVACPYHFSWHLFTEIRRSSYGPMAFAILTFTSSLAMWSLYEILRSLRKHLISYACILISMSAVMVHVSHAYKNMDMSDLWVCVNGNLSRRPITVAYTYCSHALQHRVLKGPLVTALKYQYAGFCGTDFVIERDF